MPENKYLEDHYDHTRKTQYIWDCEKEVLPRC